MKKFFAMALAALTVASCSKRQEGNETPGGGNEMNTPTYATFNFNIGGGVKAAGEYNPTQTPANDAAEAKIGKLQLLIFNATTKVLEHNSILDATKTSKTVLLTAGTKKIFFVANSDKLTAYNAVIAPATFTPGTATLDEFYALHFSAGTPQQSGVDKTVTERTFNFSDLYSFSSTVAGSEAGLPMSSTNALTYTLAAGIDEKAAQDGTAVVAGTSPTNTFKIQLYYMVAKSRLALAAEVLNDGTDGKPVIKDVQYTIRNLARATNYVQDVSMAGAPQSYYYSKTFADAAAFHAEFDDASTISVPAAVAAGDYLYVPENNAATMLRGQSSYFAIEATFEPTVINKVEYDIHTRVKYTSEKLAVADPTTKSYIYTVADVQGIPADTYFVTLGKFQEAAWIMKNNAPFDEAKRGEAEALITAADFISFQQAKSYYRVDLSTRTGAEAQYGVLRSNKYDATINQILGPGVPSEEGLIIDPTNPVSAKTYISATIAPSAWTPVSQSADL